jgi:BirA family transcriptional regulator, biotin operon repressor / biotin---[acetyl-CoA-carboxylase] ligase
VTALGRPRLHLRETASTQDRARALAEAGAPHGTTVTAGRQSAGRGRQGRSWSAPAGRALLVSVVLRGEVTPLLPLAAGVAVARATGGRVKWPNDVLLDGRKLAGVLAEARPQQGWAVLGIGVNVAVRPDDLPPEVRDRAATLGRPPEAVEAVLADVLRELTAALALPPGDLLAALRGLDALAGREIAWSGGRGVAGGIDAEGRLLVRTAAGEQALTAGEVHLGAAPGRTM